LDWLSPAEEKAAAVVAAASSRDLSRNWDTGTSRLCSAPPELETMERAEPRSTQEDSEFPTYLYLLDHRLTLPHHVSKIHSPFYFATHPNADAPDSLT
jgi:hypothetical protein